MPLALPVLATRSGQAIRHGQNPWHTERNEQLISVQRLYKALVSHDSLRDPNGLFAERTTTLLQGGLPTAPQDVVLGRSCAI